jgi:hypothetical protein
VCNAAARRAFRLWEVADQRFVFPFALRGENRTTANDAMLADTRQSRIFLAKVSIERLVTNIPVFYPKWTTPAGFELQPNAHFEEAVCCERQGVGLLEKQVCLQDWH